MAAISTVTLSETRSWSRVDAEFFQPHYRKIERDLMNFPKLGTLVCDPIIHPAEIKREYVETGISFLLAQYIRPVLLEFDEPCQISFQASETIPQNRLYEGDVLVTRTGANYGDCSVYLGEPTDFFASAHCLIIRPREISGEYTAVFLNTEVGRSLIKRGAYGSSQPELAPSYIRTIPIVRLGKLEDKIVKLVREAHDLKRTAKELYPRAERFLSQHLGWENIDTIHDLAYEVSLSCLEDASRLDAEFFQPIYESILSNVKRFKCLPLGDVTSKVQNGKTPASEEYAEHGECILKVVGLQSNGFIEESGAYVSPEWARKNTKGAVNEYDALMLCAAHLPSYIGKTGLLMKDLTPKARAVGELIIIRFLKEIDAAFGCVYLNLQPVRAVIQRMVRGNTAHLYPDDLRKLPVPILSYDVQKEIGNLLKMSYQAHVKSNNLLEQAKDLVESAIRVKCKYY